MNVLAARQKALLITDEGWRSNIKRLDMTKHELAEWLHDNYEQLAKAENWQTQEITRVKFDDLPLENRATMLALADRMLKTFKIISLNLPVISQVCDHNPIEKGQWYECSKCGQIL
jgi:hypothetical protein